MPFLWLLRCWIASEIVMREMHRFERVAEHRFEKMIDDGRQCWSSCQPILHYPDYLHQKGQDCIYHAHAQLMRCFSVESFSLCEGLLRQFFGEEVNLSIQHA